MKAVIYTQYGTPEVLRQVDMPTPQPGPKEILVRVHASTVAAADARLRASRFPPLFWLPARLIFGLFKPKKQILGHEWAGTVVEKGKEVSRFEVGDEVFGTTTLLKRGAYAAYVCIPESWKNGVVGHKPTNLSFQEAAAIPIGGMTALFLLEKAQLMKGHQVLIYGASGSVGSYAVQIARHLGAKVTAVCSTRNVELMQGLGADQIIDYKQEEYTSRVSEFDVVLDAVGKTSLAKARPVLKPSGNYVSVNMMTREKETHLGKLKQMAEQGHLKPVIDRSYPLENIVEAHAYVDQGHKQGNVVVEVMPDALKEPL